MHLRADFAPGRVVETIDHLLRILLKVVELAGARAELKGAAVARGAYHAQLQRHADP